MYSEFTLHDIVFSIVYNKYGKIDWVKTLPQQKSETFKEWQKRRKALSGRYQYSLIQRNPEKKKSHDQRSLDWKANNVDAVKQYGARVYNEKRYHKLWMAARHRAKKSNLVFSLDLEKVKLALEFGFCEVTGIKFNFENKRSAFAPSIDRINNNFGYSNTNCKIVCWCFNTGKNHFSINEFITVCEKVIENKKLIINTYKNE